MAFQRLKPFIGPKNFVFKDPDSGFKFTAKTKGHLIAHIQKYRVQNGLMPLENIMTVLENYWCSLPENIGSCEPNPTLGRGLLAYIKGGIVLFQNVAYKLFVPQEEADRRSDICLECPANKFPDKGPFVKWSDEIAIASVGDKRSKNHKELGNCEVCSCPLKAKVFYTGDLEFTQEEYAKMKTLNCWQVEESKYLKTKVKD